MYLAKCTGLTYFLNLFSVCYKWRCHSRGTGWSQNPYNCVWLVFYSRGGVWLNPDYNIMHRTSFKETNSPPNPPPVPDRGTGEGRYMCPWQACATTACSEYARLTLWPDLHIYHTYFTFWCLLTCMFYPVCGMVHIKEPLLLIEKCSPCGGSGFPLSLSKWSFTICPMPYNRK